MRTIPRDRPTDCRSRQPGAFGSALSLVDGIVWRPRISLLEALAKRIRSFGFPQHLHSIKVTRRGLLSSPRDLPAPPRRLFPARREPAVCLPRAGEEAHSRATTCLLEEGSGDFSLCGSSIRNEMEDIGRILPRPFLSSFIPRLLPKDVRAVVEKCKSRSGTYCS